MAEIVRHPIFRLNIPEFRRVMRYFFQMSRMDWAAVRRTAGMGLVKAWKESVERSKIREKTGWLKKSARWRSVGQYEVMLEVIAWYAAALYYGANPSPGRYVPYMPCVGRGARLVNPWRTYRVKLRKYPGPLIGGRHQITAATYRRWSKGVQRGRFPEGYKIVPYDIGIHPGINARQLGLRANFEELGPLYAYVNVVRLLERRLGVKIV